MDGTKLGNEIKNGMNIMAGDIKLAGKIRNAQLVARQGYIALVKPEAVAAFRANPDYKDWSYQFVDGEYRFFPPADQINELLDLLNKYNRTEQKNKAVNTPKEPIVGKNTLTDAWDTKQTLETYKKEIADLNKITFVSITVLPDDPSKCRYRLISTDKRSGEQKVVQNFTAEFEGKFAMELLPSIYNQLMGGLPVIDNEKGEENQRTISFQSIENNKVMTFGNLTESQLQLIKNMKEFVDKQYFNLGEENEKNVRKR